MDRIKNYFIRPWNSDAMLSITPISPNVREHLFMVYWTLFCSFASILSGAISHLLFNNGGWVSAIGFIGSTWWIPRINPWREIRRLLILMLASYFFGATLGPLINLIIEIDQRNIIKIIFGGIMFFSCYLGAITHSLEPNVIYQLAEYSAPIVICTWMVHTDTHPDFLTLATCLVCLPFQWLFVVRVGALIARKLRMWFNMPSHLAWILFLCYYYEHSIHDVMIVYVILTWLFVHMNLYNQLAIFRAIHNSDENYYVSAAITFFTEFPVLIIDLLRQPGDVAIMVRRIRTRFEGASPRPRVTRSEAAGPRPRGTRTRGGRT